MKRTFKEINFVKDKSQQFQFDIVTYEDLLKKKPQDHNQFEFHKISFYAILLFSQKSGQYNLNFQDYDIKKGTLFTLRKDNVHKFYKNKAKGILLVFTEDFILNQTNEIKASQTFLLFNEMLTSPKLQLNDTEYNDIITLINLIKEEYYGAVDDHSLSIVRSYLHVIITKLLRIKSQDNIVFDYHKYLSMFLQFQATVEKDCFLHKKVSYYANVLGVTPKTLNNVTLSIINKTVKSLINGIVIIQSKRLIINSTSSLTEIAYKVGFDDPTNFFKYFKKYTGVTPKQFRSANRINYKSN